jgi:ankyrin repeat protein
VPPKRVGFKLDLPCFASTETGGSPTALVELIDTQGTILHVPLISIVSALHHPHEALPECVRLLVAAGADINTVFTDGQGFPKTPLICAAEHSCCSKALQLVLDHGADVLAQPLPARRTALHRAAEAGSVANCRLLLAASKGKLLELQDSQRRTALHCAATRGHLPVVELLHGVYGADLNRPAVGGYTALHLATGGEHTAVMQFLLRNGADVQATSEHEQTALQLAVSKGSVPAVEVLLQHGAVQDSKQGALALMWAILAGSIPV